MLDFSTVRVLCLTPPSCEDTQLLVKTVNALIILLTFVLSGSALCAEEGKPIVRIVTENYPPYEMEPAVRGLRGFDYDVVSAAFEEVGYQTDIEFLSWSRALTLVKRGERTALLTCAYKEDRAEWFYFSDPISSFTLGFYTRGHHDGIIPHTLMDVQNQKVASVQDYASLKDLEVAGFHPQAPVSTEVALKQLVDKKWFDYLYLGKEATDFVAAQNDLAERISFYPTSKDDFHLCFSKQDPKAKQIMEDFNRGLASIRAGGIYEQIHARYR